MSDSKQITQNFEQAIKRFANEEEEESSEEEEPIVIKLLDSMLPKNTYTPIELGVLQEMLPSAEELKEELRQILLKEGA
jgi:hypothetical protein